MTKLKHKFVKRIPETVENGVLYISMKYNTVIHNCPCGCGNRVNTPLSPIGWNLFYDGNTVSLSPSVGNWSYECKSHYWIKKSEIVWSNKWSNSEIELVRKQEREKLDNYYSGKNSTEKVFNKVNIEDIPVKPKKSWFKKLMFWK